MEKQLTNPSKKRILESAEKLFALQGFAGTSLREISKLSGLNTSLISYYFGNKTGLYEAVILGRLEEFKASFTQLFLLKKNPGLDLFLSCYINWFSEHHYFFNLINREFSSSAHTPLKAMISETLTTHFLQMKALLKPSGDSGDEIQPVFLYLITYGLLQAYLEHSPIHHLASGIHGQGRLDAQKIRQFLFSLSGQSFSTTSSIPYIQNEI